MHDPNHGPQVPVGTDIQGPAGTARFVPYTSDEPRAAAHLCTYLIDSPGWHPLWTQYSLAVVTLTEAPGLPTPYLQFPGATHELIVFALNPDHHQTVATMLDHCARGTMPYLTPVNVVHQFEATDDEMRQVAWLAARGVVNAYLNPETGSQWLTACVRTLAHLRGEEHAP